MHFEVQESLENPQKQTASKAFCPSQSGIRLLKLRLGRTACETGGNERVFAYLKNLHTPIIIHRGSERKEGTGAQIKKEGPPTNLGSLQAVEFATEAICTRMKKAFKIEEEILRKSPRFALCDNPWCGKCRFMWGYNKRDLPMFYLRHLLKRFTR